MKFKILRTILFYLDIIFLSYSVYLKNNFAEGFIFFCAMLIVSGIYLWVEYSDFEK